MKTIGLIGGMSWQSSAQYYRILNEAVGTRLGGLHSAQILLFSVDFDEVGRRQHEGDREGLTLTMTEACKRLEMGGADFFLICSNTMHRIADEVAASVRIPLLHIIDPIADKVKADGHQCVGLLGTVFTMSGTFYSARLASHGLEVLVPHEGDQMAVHRIIYDELVRGDLNSQSRTIYQDVISRLLSRGATAIILGCTEIMLLVNDADSPVPLYDTTKLHALAAVELAITGEGPPSQVRAR